MTKKEFVGLVHSKLVKSKAADKDISQAFVQKVLDAVVEVVKEQVANGTKVPLVRFGTFERVE